MVTTLSDLPYELLLKVAQYLSFSDLWYLGTCSKQIRTVSFELILSKYQINVIRPKVINPFAQLVHAAVAYLERYGHLTTTIQSVANHLTVAINDRTPEDIGKSATLDFLLDKCLAILIDSIFLDLPFASPEKLQAWCQLSPPTLNENVQDNAGHTSENNANRNHNMTEISSMVTSSLSSTGTTTATTSESSSSPTSEIETTATVSPSTTSASPYGYDPQIVSTAIRMADFLSTLDSVLTAIFVAPPHRQLLMSHLHRVLVHLTKQYRKQGQDDMAKAGLRICVIFLSRLVEGGVLPVSDVVAFAHQLPEFFVTQPNEIRFGRLPHYSNNERQRLQQAYNPSQQRQQQEEEDRRPLTMQAFMEHVNDNQQANATHPVLYNIGGNLVMGMTHPNWLLWLHETEFRMMILLDLVRVVMGQLQCHDRESDIANLQDIGNLQVLTTMLQDTFSAFTSFKP